MIAELGNKIDDTLRSQGSDIYDRLNEKFKPILNWIDYFERSGSSVCPVLLTGLRAILAEVTSCAVIGYLRPALTLIRSEIDVALAWLYYSEHPREWKYVNVTEDGFKLKSELLRTFEQIEPAFRRRFSLLKQVRRRTQEDPYRLLSAHIHLQSEAVMPSLNCLADIVQPKSIQQLVAMQDEVSEYISDVNFAMFANDWIALPEFLTTNVTSRFISPEQFKEFIREN